MNVLITGGLGVNGSWVTRKLIQRGLHPVVFGQSGETDLVGPEIDQATLIRGDVNDIATLIEVIQEHDIDVVIHLAAMVVGLQQMQLQAFRVNALGTVQVLEAARIAGVRRVVFTSSRAVWGDVTGAAAHPQYAPMDEDYPVNPTNVYDACKVASEVMGRNYAREFGLEFLALRFSAIIGPGKPARHGATSLYSAMIEESLAGRPVDVAQGSEQLDDVIYADDAAEGIVLAAFHERPAHDTYNISRGVGTSLGDLADAVRKHLPDAAITIGPGLDFFQLGTQYYGVMDPSRAREDLGFEARFDLDAAVGHYLATMEELGIEPPPERTVLPQ